MADTNYGLNHPLAVRVWSRKLIREALKETFFSRFMGEGSNALCQVKPELSNSAGSRITFGLRVALVGRGQTGDDDLEGNEESLTTYADDVYIDQLRHAVRSKGKMSEQRVPFNVREEARVALGDWLQERLDTSFFNQLAGNTGQTDVAYTGLQAATAPTSTRILYHNGTHGSELSLSTTDTFILTLIDRAISVAKTSAPYIRPFKDSGDNFYVCFLHPYQVYNLRTDATAGRVTWYDAQKARVQGGQTGERTNPIFSGALGVYNGVILHESTRIPVAPTNSSVRRAVFCGAQAAVMAMGRTNNPDEPNWVEEMFDYRNKLGVSAGMIMGMKKTVFNSVDFATIVISTYAAAP